jgi:hypothetical protein
MMGHYVPYTDVSVVTVARWREGQMIEGYLFTRRLADDERDPQADAEPFVTITSPDSRLLQVAADVRPGWSCVIRGDKVGSRSLTLARREGDTVVEQFRYADV